LFYSLLLRDKGKPVERQGRKAIGPVRWQPATERSFNMKKFMAVLILVVMVIPIFNGSVAEAANGFPKKGNETEVANIIPMTGAWLGSWPTSDEKNIEHYNQLAKKPSNVIHTFINISQDTSWWKGSIDYVKSQGAMNLLTLEMKKSDGQDYSTVDINNGLLDAQFINLAKQLKSWQNGSEIWIRPLHEVNGNWYGWCIGDSQVNTNETYIAAFQRVVEIFRANEASNVKFVYNVNDQNVGKGSSYMEAYPGDDYVDYVSMDGYNWGTSRSGSTWQEFREIFDKPYNALVAGSERPVIIAEFASTEIGGSKPAWIIDMKNQIRSGAYPKLIAAIWFNENKETDWRIESTTSSLVAYKE